MIEISLTLSRLFATKRSEDPRRRTTTIVLDILALLMQLSAYVIVLASMKSECVKSATEETEGKDSIPILKLPHHLITTRRL